MANGSNTSDGRSIKDEGMSWYWWLCGVIAVITVLGNMLVILLILTRSSLRTTHNWFVLSLAVADVLVGLAIFPLRCLFNFLYSAENQWGYILYRTYDFLIYTSMTNLCALTLDRYLYIIHPLKHIFLKKKANVIMTLALAWFLGFLFSFAQLLMNIFVRNNETKYEFFLMFCIKTPLCLYLTIAYFRILYFARRQQAQIKNQANQLQHNYPAVHRETEQRKKNNRMTRVLGGIIGFFVVSYIVNTFNAYSLYFPTLRFNTTLHRISMSLVYANSAINVFCYGLFKKDFRREMAKLFCTRVFRGTISPRFDAPAAQRTTKL